MVLPINMCECLHQKALDWFGLRSMTFRCVFSGDWVRDLGLSAAHSNLVLPVVLNLYPTTENSRMADTLPRSSQGPMQRGSEGNIVLWSNGAHRGMPSICIARSNGAPSGMPSCRCRGVMAPVAECLPTVSHTIPSLVKLFDLAANIELVSQQRSLYMLPLGGPPRIIGLYKSSNSRSLTSQVATS